GPASASLRPARPPPFPQMMVSSSPRSFPVPRRAAGFSFQSLPQSPAAGKACPGAHAQKKDRQFSLTVLWSPEGGQIRTFNLVKGDLLCPFLIIEGHKQVVII